MSTEDGSAAAEVSSEEVSTEIGSGDVEAVVVEAAGGEGGELSADQIDEVAEVIEEAVEAGASDAEIKSLIRTYKIKVNGEDKDVELDFSNEADIIRRLQMAEAGQSAMHKSAEMEKLFNSEAQRLVDDPWGVMAEMGMDPDEMAEARIQQQIEQLQKSPEQIEREDQSRELEALRAKLKKQDEDKQTSDFQVLQKQAESDLKVEITEAISSTSQLPKAPYVMKRVADALMFAIDNGFENATAKDVMPTVEKEIHSEMREFMEQMPDKFLEEFMGKQITDRLRKQRLSKMPANLNKVRDTGKKEEVMAPTKKQSLRDFMKNGIK
jgi:hypothetical protein